jgi:hypothetical protein
MEQMIAWRFHNSFLFRNNWLLYLCYVNICRIDKEILKAYTTLHILILLIWFYFEIVIIIVRLENLRDQKSRSKFVLQK